MPFDSFYPFHTTPHSSALCSVSMSLAGWFSCYVKIPHISEIIGYWSFSDLFHLV